jgi:hypothetical protein
MSARRLRRLAGLVFVLAAIFGAVGSAGFIAQQSAADRNVAAEVSTESIIDWS